MEIDGNSSKIIEAAYGKSRKSMRSLWELMENSKKFVKFMEIHGNLEKKFIEIDGNTWKLMFKEIQRKIHGNSQKPLETDANS